MTKRILIATLLAGLLSGCALAGLFRGGGKGLEVEANQVKDVPTKDLVKSLPHDLHGDTTNARHTGQTLRGDDSTGDASPAS